MVRRSFSAQKGLSLVRLTTLIVIVVVVAIVVLSLFPRISGTPLQIFNQITDKAKSMVSSLTAATTNVGKYLSAKWAPISEWIDRKIEDLKDFWCRKMNPEKCPPLKVTRAIMKPLGVCAGIVGDCSDLWCQDMTALIDGAENNGYNMAEVCRLLKTYMEGTASAKRVESEFWKQMQNQTVEFITKNINLFRTRPIGCSDFTVELIKIWEIVQKFNAEDFLEYLGAKQLSEQLADPRSLEFAQDTFGWLGFPNSTWFLERLAQAIDKTTSTPNYPAIIQQIDARLKQANNPFEQVIGNMTVGEIYLNYELINPAQDRFDEAIRQLSTIAVQYGNTIPASKLVGLHMALGLLNERVCKNNDLAIKEFKDVVAYALRGDIKCEYYNSAHYQLGIINLRLRDGNQVKPQFEKKPSAYAGTTEDLFKVTPTPAPTPIPTATPVPNPLRLTIEIPSWVFNRQMERLTRAMPRAFGTPGMTTGVPGMPGVMTGNVTAGRPTGMPGVTVGNVPFGRPIRLRPRKELGDIQQMKEFKIEDLYDLSNIPDDAIREFELYLKCNSEPSRARIARFIHDKYMGK